MIGSGVVGKPAGVFEKVIRGFSEMKEIMQITKKGGDYMKG